MRHHKNADVSNYPKSEGGKLVAADQSHLSAKASIADIATEMENDWRKSVRKLGQAYDVLTKTVHATLCTDLQLPKKLARWVTKLI
jgi:hypothetical protein